jgi:hypothetical protein
MHQVRPVPQDVIKTANWGYSSAAAVRHRRFEDSPVANAYSGNLVDLCTAARSPTLRSASGPDLF